MCESSEDEFEIDDFKNSKKNIKKFHENLFPKANTNQEKEHNQFVRAILYAVRFDRTNEKEICGKQEFEKSIDKKLTEQLDQPENFQFIVDLQKLIIPAMKLVLFYQNMRIHVIRTILKDFELKNKFRHLSMKEPKNETLMDNYQVV